MGLLLVGATDCSTAPSRVETSSNRVVCSEQVHCANGFRMGSSNSCACASVAFLVRIISWSVDSIAAHVVR